MSYQNVKITELPKISNANANDLFLVSRLTNVESYPYESNAISVGGLSSTIKTALECNSMSISGEWRFNGNSNDVPKVNSNIDPSDFLNALKDPEKLSSFNSLEDGSWYKELSTTVVENNGKESVQSLSIANDSIPNIAFVERAIAGIYSDKANYIDPSNYSISSIRYSIARIGDSKLISGGGQWGVFNNGVKQTTIVNGNLEEYKCQNISSCLTGAYFDTDTISTGHIVSDGHYFYYKTASDCTLLLKYSSDAFSQAVDLTKSWVLCNVKDVITNIKAIPLLEKVQINRYNGYPYGSIMLPVKAGTVIMVGVYLRQPLGKNLPFYIEQLQAPVISESGVRPIDNFSDLISPATTSLTATYTYSEYSNGEDHVSRAAGIYSVNGSTKSNYFSDTPSLLENHYSFGGTKFGTAFYIYELP